MRPIDKTEFPSFARVLAEAFSSTRDLSAAGDRLINVVEFERTLAAFDDDEIVGTTATYSFQMGVPGATTAVGGVSGVATLPTHRRRGVLRSLMTRQLADIRDSGEAVAALWASEGSIYGRFGFGPATWAADIQMDLTRASLRPDAPRDDSLTLRFVREDVAATIGPVFAAATANVPGEFARDSRWWERLLDEAPEARAGMSEIKCVVAEGDSGPVGYALYRVRPGWSPQGLPDGMIAVLDTQALTPAAHTALWEHLVGRDLMARLSMEDYPLDGAVYGLVNDPFHINSTLTGNLWVRLVDVPAALEQRRYGCDVDLVLDITDATCPWNTGRWRLKADRDRAVCGATDAEPDLRMDVATLGASYMGTPPLHAVASGQVTERRPHAFAEFATALAWPQAGHCGLVF